MTRVHLIDATFPVVSSLTAPATLQGARPAVFTANFLDDVELKDRASFVRYSENGLNIMLEEPAVSLGSYGPDDLQFQTSGTTSIGSFIRSIETTSGDRPTGSVSRATEFTYWVRDQAGNATGQTSNILSALRTGIGGDGTEVSWGELGRAFNTVTNPLASFQNNTPGATICVDSDGDGCSVPTARALSAVAVGPANTFVNPFANLYFYYRHPLSGRWFFIGAATASSTNSTGARVWTYASVNFTAPLGFAAGTVFNVMALGVDASGRGLATGLVAFTQVVD